MSFFVLFGGAEFSSVKNRIWTWKTVSGTRNFGITFNYVQLHSNYVQITFDCVRVAQIVRHNCAKNPGSKWPLLQELTFILKPDSLSLSRRLALALLAPHTDGMGRGCSRLEEHPLFKKTGKDVKWLLGGTALGLHIYVGNTMKYPIFQLQTWGKTHGRKLPFADVIWIKMRILDVKSTLWT